MWEWIQCSWESWVSWSVRQSPASLWALLLLLYKDQPGAGAEAVLTQPSPQTLGAVSTPAKGEAAVGSCTVLVSQDYREDYGGEALLKSQEHFSQHLCFLPGQSLRNEVVAGDVAEHGALVLLPYLYALP